MKIIEQLNWRYATKAMDGRRIPEDKIGRILEAARLAPSSNGLQPFEIIVISNQELKEKIRPAAFDQQQITGCSHLLVFAAWDQYTPGRIDAFIEHTARERGGDPERLERHRQSLLNNFGSMDKDRGYAHAARQAYLSLGVTIVAAAAEGVDGTPMEGFDPVQLDEILGLKQKGLRSAVIIALGYRDTEKDWLVNLKKVRKHKDQFITELN
ncbi:NAD(P)H-dependent oxidoreductase [Niabella drilacis]|uniref:Nitroreductase n=1 Tax=Niabella drilacis (strain DSM 25811 / CCM 8410 / CCUG 62505 / LMG 26954 / E90) TaxID=1285928 RepID=A0A1G6T904_NIADE|nr:NAD(P)H-dependent oxidoreductase [Niabella drilacis]SDD25026.1 Nitroreductase [Niabella drilacis]